MHQIEMLSRTISVQENCLHAARGMQVVPEVVSKVTEKAKLYVSYNGKAISNGEEMTPSETQVPACRL